MKQTTYGIIVWLIVTLYVTYAFCLNTAAAVFSDSIKSSLHISDMAVSYIMAAYIAGYAGSQIPAGYLLDRFNPKYVVGTGLVLLAIGNILFAFSHTVSSLIASNLIQGIGGAFAFIAAGVIISQWFAPKQFPIMFGLTQSLSCILSGVFHYQMMGALKYTTWNAVYQALGAFGMILFLLAIIFVKRPSMSSSSEAVSLFQSIKITCSSRQLLLCTLATATSFGVLLAYASYWYMNIEKYYLVNSDNAFIIGGMIFAGIGVGTPVLGWVSNKIQSRMKVIHTALVFGVMMLLANIYLPHFQIESLIIIKTISFLTGFFLSGSMLLYTVVNEISTNNVRGVALSVTNTGVFLMNTLMLFIPYMLVTHASSQFFTYLWIFPFIILSSIAAVFFIHESYPLPTGDHHDSRI